MYGTSHKLYILVEALLYIAHYPSMQPLGGKKLSTVLNIPPRYLELWMQSLVRANILRSIRGPRGGYMLARDRRDIRMDEVLLAFDHHQPKEIPSGPPSGLRQKIISPLFEQAERAYLHAFSTMTLEQLCDQAFIHGFSSSLILERFTYERLDFSI